MAVARGGYTEGEGREWGFSATTRCGRRSATRAPLLAIDRGADFGECVTTVQRVGAGNVDDWYREWVRTADRVAAIGDASAAAGHRVSAREAYYRACNYYRSAYFPLYGAPIDPRLVDAFDKETATFLKGAA